MRSTVQGEILLQLVQVAVGAKDRSAGLIEGLKQAVSKADPGLCVIDGGEKWRAPDVGQRRLGR